MDLISYEHKPTVVQVAAFDGNLDTVRSFQDWISQTSGMAAVVAQAGTNDEDQPLYRLYVPTQTGTQVLEPGGYLLLNGTNFYPIDQASLDANYQKQEGGDEGSVPEAS